MLLRLARHLWFSNTRRPDARHTDRPRPDEVPDHLQDKQGHRPTDQAAVYQGPRQSDCQAPGPNRPVSIDARGARQKDHAC